MAKYAYTLIPGTKLYRPLIDIQLSHPNTGKATPPIQAVLDSGADICMASQDIALWLGIMFEGNEEVVTFATANETTSQAIKKTITFITQEGIYKCPFFFVDGITPDKKPLLGQQGFFDHFKVCFDLKNKAFEIF